MCVLVVVHPHLEDVAFDSDLGAELVERHVVVPLHPPPYALRERQHPIFLLLRELRPRPLARRRRPHPGHRIAGTHLHVHVHLLSLRRLRPSIVVSVRRTAANVVMVVTRFHRSPAITAVLVVMVQRGRAAMGSDHHLGVPPGCGGCGIVHQHRRRGVDGEVQLVVVVGAGEFPAVEVPVTTAGSAGEGVAGPVVGAWHELAATVVGVAADGSGMIPHALAVLDVDFGERVWALVKTLGLDDVAVVALVGEVVVGFVGSGWVLVRHYA